MQERSRHHGRAVAQLINKGYRTQKDYQLTKLLLAVEPEIPNNNDKLAHERNPEGGGSHWASSQSFPKVPSSRVWEDTFRTNPIGGSGTGDHYTHCTNDLRECQRRADVES